MASHFYGVTAVGQTVVRDPSKIAVSTTTAAGNQIELRVTDGVLTARQVYAFCEYMADLFARRESSQVVSAGTLIG